MLKLSALDSIGPHGTTYTQGEVLFNKLLEALKTGDTVELDMRGMETTSSSFFNAAIGELYTHIAPKDLANRLHITNLTPSSRFVLIRSIRAAKREPA